ncbi:hypothetical protein [Pseudotenacibaculum haliotis]|uniref:Uncharacterized protein n=1 Tax=Pseudotenacibaculum haliotis TaxID=1862138 RepID=A0ABW5LWM8_9FLAO
MIRFQTAKKKLATLWFIASGIIFILMILLSFDKLKNDLSDAWGWLFPNILPTLTLILTIFFTDMQQANPQNEKMVDKFYFKLSFYLSLFYLIVLLSTILSAGLGFDIMESMENSNFYLGPIQGIIGASLGLFFFKTQEQSLEE